MITLLILSGILFAAVHVWSTIMIYAFLKSRSEKIESFLWIRLYTFYYVSQYRAITTKERGRPGYLFHVYVISINLALICFILALLLKFCHF